MNAHTKKLTEVVTVRLDEDDVRDLDLLVRDDTARHNGRASSQSVVIRELIRERVACLRARTDAERSR
jgi:hypothetical protein